MLSITISIADISTDIHTDQNLSFDAIDSLINRAVQSTLQAYLSIPLDDRLAPYKTLAELEEEEGDTD
jgi:hypothetical protein